MSSHASLNATYHFQFRGILSSKRAEEIAMVQVGEQIQQHLLKDLYE